MKYTPKIIIVVLSFLISQFVHADSYDVDKFQPLGFSLGASEKEALDAVAKFLSIDPEQFELAKEYVLESWMDTVEPSITRRYEYEGHSLTLALYPDLANEEDKKKVVVGKVAYYPHQSSEKMVRLKFIEAIRNNIVEKHGPATKAFGVGHNNPLEMDYFWCKKLRESGALPCDRLETYLHMTSNNILLENVAYKKAWENPNK